MFAKHGHSRGGHWQAGQRLLVCLIFHLPNARPAIHYRTCFSLMERLLWRMNIWLWIIRRTVGAATVSLACVHAFSGVTRVDRLREAWRMATERHRVCPARVHQCDVMATARQPCSALQQVLFCLRLFVCQSVCLCVRAKTEKLLGRNWCNCVWISLLFSEAHLYVHLSPLPGPFSVALSFKSTYKACRYHIRPFHPHDGPFYPREHPLIGGFGMVCAGPGLIWGPLK